MYISNEIWIDIYEVSEPINGPISVIIELYITLLQLIIIISFKLRNNYHKRPPTLFEIWKDISSQYISIRFQITWNNLINEDNSLL